MGTFIGSLMYFGSVPSRFLQYNRDGGYILFLWNEYRFFQNVGKSNFLRAKGIAVGVLNPPHE